LRQPARTNANAKPDGLELTRETHRKAMCEYRPIHDVINPWRKAPLHRGNPEAAGMPATGRCQPSNKRRSKEAHSEIWEETSSGKIFGPREKICFGGEMPDRRA
jgi:hypothetical protein